MIITSKNLPLLIFSYRPRLKLQPQLQHPKRFCTDSGFKLSKKSDSGTCFGSSRKRIRLRLKFSPKPCGSDTLGPESFSAALLKIKDIQTELPFLHIFNESWQRQKNYIPFSIRNPSSGYQLEIQCDWIRYSFTFIFGYK